MKKIIAILVLVICAGTFIKAQDYKPVAGQAALELNFTPLSAAPIGLNYLKVRYFVDDQVVFRIGLDIRRHSEKSEPINTTNPDVMDESKMSYTQFGIYPGLEMHFEGTDRFSPYIGAEIAFDTKGAKASYTDNDANTTTESDGAWLDGSNRGFTKIGVNLLAGADFYFAKKLYFGAELGFGFLSTTMKEVKGTVGSTTTTTSVKSSSSDIGFNFNPAIRLGFCF